MATAKAELIGRLGSVAKSAGVPRDALENFLRAGYVPQPKQLQFHAAARECDRPDGPTQVGFGGARGPGKSHAVFAQVALDDCRRVPGLKVLYLRKVQKGAREQMEDLRLGVLRHVPHDYKRQEGIIKFPQWGNSRIILGHFNSESDIDQYLGLEYDVIVPEEATTLSLSKYRALRDSNRTSKPGFRPRIYPTTNPGGVGHAWFKATFIVPARKGKESDTRFIFATVDDNKFIDPDYTKKLEENTGWKLKAYRYGDWDIAAGQYFSTWSRDAIVKPDLRVMPNSPVWCALDYGFQHPTVCYLFNSYDGKQRIIDEHWRQKALVSENAADITAMLERHGLTVKQLECFVAGPDVFSQLGNESGKTRADEYLEHGIRLTGANTDRISGAGHLLKLMGSVERGIEPQLEISDRCTRLIECLPSMQHNPKRPEDVLKVDVDEDGNGGDDPYDTARYGVMVKFRPPQKDPDLPGTTGYSIFNGGM
jgi:PBSX family phage terminase large subunit